MTRPSEIRALSHPELAVARQGIGVVIDTLIRHHGPDITMTNLWHEVGVLGDGLERPLKSYEISSLLVWIRWVANGRPIYALEPDLMWALVHTAPMSTRLEALPELPVDGMYLSLPPGIHLGRNPDDPKHAYMVEGVYLIKDRGHVETDAAGIPIVGPGLLSHGQILTVGEAAHTREMDLISVVAAGRREDQLGDVRTRYTGDDQLLVFGISASTHLESLLSDEAFDGVPEITRLVVNLLHLMNATRDIASTTVDPGAHLRGLEGRPLRRERERMEGKGRSALPCRVLHLRDLGKSLPARAQADVSPDGAVPPERVVRRHIVAGHIHHYWVVDAQDTPVVRIREGERRNKLIARWLRPYWRGDARAGTVPKTVMVA
jgi:hypothetical protein